MNPLVLDTFGILAIQNLCYGRRREMRFPVDKCMLCYFSRSVETSVFTLPEEEFVAILELF